MNCNAKVRPELLKVLGILNSLLPSLGRKVNIVISWIYCSLLFVIYTGFDILSAVYYSSRVRGAILVSRS